MHKGCEFKRTKGPNSILVSLVCLGAKKWVTLPKRKSTLTNLYKCLFTESKRSLVMKPGYCNNPASPSAKEGAQSIGWGQRYMLSLLTGPASILRLYSRQLKLLGTNAALAHSMSLIPTHQIAGSMGSLPSACSSAECSASQSRSQPMESGFWKLSSNNSGFCFHSPANRSF